MNLSSTPIEVFYPDLWHMKMEIDVDVCYDTSQDGNWFNVKCLFHGPLIFIPNRQIPNSIDFIIFTPQYMFRTIPNTFISEVIPLTPQICGSFLLKFRSKENLNFHVKCINTSRKQVSSFTFYNTAYTPVAVDQIYSNGETHHKEISLSLGTQKNLTATLILRDLNTYKEISKPLDMRASVSVTSLLEREVNFPLKNPMTMTFGKDFHFSFDDLGHFMLYFIIIHSAIVSFHDLKNTLKFKNQVNFARALRSADLDMVCEYKSTMGPMTCEFPKSQIPNPIFAPVTVPAKASSRFEILSFGLPISRHLFVVHHEPRTKSIRDRKMSEKVRCVPKDAALEFYINKVKQESIVTAPIINTSQLTMGLFQICDDTLKDMLHESFGYMDGRMRHSLPACVAELAKKIGMDMEERLHSFLPGEAILRALNECLTNIQKPTVSLSSSHFLTVCSITALLLTDYPINAETLWDDFKELFKGDPAVLACFTHINSTKNKFVLLAARLYVARQLGRFLITLMGSSDWRECVFLPGSLMRHTQLLGDIKERMSAFCSKPYTGKLSKDAIASFVPPIGKQSLDARIIVICEQILKMQTRKAATDQLERAYGMLIAKLTEFFENGYKPPKTAIIAQMRHPWYLFVSGVDLVCNESRSLEAAVADTIKKADTTNPRTLLQKLLLKGLTSGTAWAYAALAASKGAEDGVYAEGAPVLDRAAIASVVMSLSTLRTVYLKFKKKTVLSFAAGYTQ